jgi:dihydroxyacetone kinase-like protein
MNFEMADELVDFDDIKCLHVKGCDDVASADKGDENKRRGVAGIYFVFKCAGAAADAMLPLEEVARIAEKANASVRTFGVALSPCIIPENGKANFTVKEGEMELGMGIHGEPGVEVCPVKTADETVDYMLERILKDLETKAGDEVAVLMNGLGATPLEELYIMYRRVHETLTAQGLKVYFAKLGEFATSMDMIGASVSVMKLDDELKKYLSAEADTPFIHQNAIG